MRTALAALTLFAPIVVRHDRDDADYRALAARYPAVCDVGADGVGVLIAPRWVLTAGHVARGMTPFSAAVGFGGRGLEGPAREHAVDAAVVHPRFREGPHGVDADVALLRLVEPVEGIEPAPLFTGGVEPGLAVELVGCGDTGTGETGAARADGLWRAARNRVLRVEGGPPADRLVFRFDAPDEGALDLEGFWGPGDSGCPAFVDVDGVAHVAAVSSHGFDPRGDGVPANYGEHDVSFRVGAYADWIEDVRLAWADRPGNLAAAVRPGAPDAEDPRGALAARWLELFASGDEAARARFVDEECARPDGPAPPDAERLWLAHRLPRGLPPLRPDGWTVLPEGRLFVRVACDAIDEPLVLTFVTRGDPPRLAEVRVSQAR